MDVLPSSAGMSVHSFFFLMYYELTRERWHNHLDPSITKAPWSLEEDRLIISLQNQFGNQWADIAERLPGE